MPVRTVPGQQYGKATAQEAAQRAVPMGPAPVAAPAPSAPQAPAQPVQRAPQPQAPVPGQFGQFARPSESPDEPITAGLSTGPGPGPEVLPHNAQGREFLDDPSSSQYVALLERAVDLGLASPATARFVRLLRSQLPVQGG